MAPFYFLIGVYLLQESNVKGQNHLIFAIMVAALTFIGLVVAIEVAADEIPSENDIVQEDT